MIKRITIIGTGLIGASIGLALREAGFAGDLIGIDSDTVESKTALKMGAINEIDLKSSGSDFENVDLILLAVPVLGILDWMRKLSPILKPHQLITDVGSTKLDISLAASRLFNSADTARFLPGHPMAGKEFGGAAIAEAGLFHNAMWLCTPVAPTSPIEEEWRAWVAKFGCRSMDLDAARHDQICAWVSHLPQMVATAMSAMFADEFAHAPELADEFEAIGGRALREMTRLGASPYSMWRDVAFTNTKPLAATLFALEQRLAHIRENLKTPELREEFEKANDFRTKR
jgi:prephenate dehydrogenase